MYEILLRYASEANPIKLFTAVIYLALPANIRLGWKGLVGTNTLAYYENSKIMAVKGFIGLALALSTNIRLGWKILVKCCQCPKKFYETSTATVFIIWISHLRICCCNLMLFPELMVARKDLFPVALTLKKTRV